MQERSASPPNSVVLVRDAARADIPESMSGQVISATSSCIAIGTLEETEGPTRIRVADSTAAGGNESLPALEVADTTLRVESGSLVVGDVLGVPYIHWPVEGPNVRVRVYVNHSTEPDEIVVVVG